MKSSEESSVSQLDMNSLFDAEGKLHSKRLQELLGWEVSAHETADLTLDVCAWLREQGEADKALSVLLNLDTETIAEVPLRTVLALVEQAAALSSEKDKLFDIENALRTAYRIVDGDGEASEAIREYWTSLLQTVVSHDGQSDFESTESGSTNDGLRLNQLALFEKSQLRNADVGAPSTDYYIVPVYFLTHRNKTGSHLPSRMFGSKRTLNQSLGRAFVSVPIAREAGSLPRAHKFWKKRTVLARTSS